jgi:hypothetical protein
MFGELLDVVHETVKLPLIVDLAPPAQREPIETLVVSKVGEHGLDDRQALRVTRPPRSAVDAPLHALSRRLGGAGVFAREEHDLARLTRIGLA